MDLTWHPITDHLHHAKVAGRTVAYARVRPRGVDWWLEGDEANAGHGVTLEQAQRAAGLQWRQREGRLFA